MNALATIPAEPLTMSSKEIADLVEKRHDNVLRDISKMLRDLDEAVLKFEGSYLGADGTQRPCYKLPKDLTLTLVAGYNVVLRKRIIDRWLALEAEKAKGVLAIPDFSDPAAAARAWAERYEAEQAAKAEKALSPMTD